MVCIRAYYINALTLWGIIILIDGQGNHVKRLSGMQHFIPNAKNIEEGVC